MSIERRSLGRVTCGPNQVPPWGQLLDLTGPNAQANPDPVQIERSVKRTLDAAGARIEDHRTRDVKSLECAPLAAPIEMGVDRARRSTIAHDG